MPTNDTFAEALARVTELSGEASSLADLARRYSYVLPEPRVLGVLRSLSPLIEIGAGTGYWAHRLRQLHTNILAFDQNPPVQPNVNRYHPDPGTWTEVLAGDQAVLPSYPQRALFVCWPPLYSSLGDCLTFYQGDTVAWIGDAGFRTAIASGLARSFEQVAAYPVRALEPWPGTQPTLTVWRRLPQPRSATRTSASRRARAGSGDT